MKHIPPGLIALCLVACSQSHHDRRLPGTTPDSLELAGSVEFAPPPFTDGVFPCTDCHDPEIEPYTERRVLEIAHTEIVLDHDEEHRWCLDCHSSENYDKLHLASGELIDFTESYRLCGQCHGDKYRDWRAGVHGRRSGEWDGQRTYLLCVHCHVSHSPSFKPIEPDPPPFRPGSLRKKVVR